MNVLSIRNLKKTYKDKKAINSTEAINGIDLDINEGEFVGIMGPSGSGKTTLLNILSGIDKATSGEIEILGKDINKSSRNDMALFRRKYLGFVFQEFNLLDSLTLKENIMLPLSLEGQDEDEVEKKTQDMMRMLGILEAQDKYPYNVSGGQQQRAAIGRAIINNPDILFADEPTGNLDSKSSAVVMEHFEKINGIQKKTIVVVTHDPFTASYCNRIVFIKDGVIDSKIEKKQGTREEFFEEILHKLAVIGGRA
ncbi:MULTISPECIES: ABC transporter ATP-binding protein [Clostridium]|uniref:ABC transporter ATP-binding protein n=1 Tax=Clostridium TaxID=1485 RepID=UPI000826022B|nr:MULTISPECIES: ABC transporter ATP-binding protein [Clostridium]PJI08181.1 ABC transporter ATP-binding protein [Clostridium sp. CT7]